MPKVKRPQTKPWPSSSKNDDLYRILGLRVAPWREEFSIQNYHTGIFIYDEEQVKFGSQHIMKIVVEDSNLVVRRYHDNRSKTGTREFNGLVNMTKRSWDLSDPKTEIMWIRAYIEGELFRHAFCR